MGERAAGGQASHGGIEPRSCQVTPNGPRPTTGDTTGVGQLPTERQRDQESARHRAADLTAPAGQPLADQATTGCTQQSTGLASITMTLRAGLAGPARRVQQNERRPMDHHCSVLDDGPNGHIVVVHIQRQELLDSGSAAERRARVSRVLGGMDVVLRCCMGDAVSVSCEPHLRRYASDPTIDYLPVFTLTEPARLQAVA